MLYAKLPTTRIEQLDRNGWWPLWRFLSIGVGFATLDSQLFPAWLESINSMFSLLFYARGVIRSLTLLFVQTCCAYVTYIQHSREGELLHIAHTNKKLKQTNPNSCGYEETSDTATTHILHIVSTPFLCLWVACWSPFEGRPIVMSSSKRRHAQIHKTQRSAVSLPARKRFACENKHTHAHTTRDAFSQRAWNANAACGFRKYHTTKLEKHPQQQQLHMGVMETSHGLVSEFRTPA